MKFEALLVSQNVNVLREMLEIMEDFSIDVDVCMLPSRAIELLAKRDVDLLVLDCEHGNGAAEIARSSSRSKCGRKTTIAALVHDSSSGEDIMHAGAFALIRKPLTSYSKGDFRNLVYSKMVKEWRREPRYAVRWRVVAKDPRDRPVHVTLMDISEHGVGLLHTGKLQFADLLKFRLSLPGMSQIIRFDACVLWTKRQNLAGAEFVSISATDADILRNWLRQRQQVRKLETEGEPCYV